MSAVPLHRPVAREKIVSPSPLVCDGAIALAYPSSAISAMRAASAFDSRAFVATTPIVVFSPARDCVFPPARSSLRASAKVLSGLRTPATTFPVAGSMTSPTAFTATMAPTTRPLGSEMDAVPIPDFVARPPPPNFPTVAPAPAPTVPSCTTPAVAPSAALYPQRPLGERVMADLDALDGSDARCRARVRLALLSEVRRVGGPVLSEVRRVEGPVLSEVRRVEGRGRPDRRRGRARQRESDAFHGTTI